MTTKQTWLLILIAHFSLYRRCFSSGRRKHSAIISCFCRIIVIESLFLCNYYWAEEIVTSTVQANLLRMSQETINLSCFFHLYTMCWIIMRKKKHEGFDNFFYQFGSTDIEWIHTQTDKASTGCLILLLFWMNKR